MHQKSPQKLQKKREKNIEKTENQKRKTDSVPKMFHIFGFITQSTVRI